jgi:hypothetical protein
LPHYNSRSAAASFWHKHASNHPISAAPLLAKGATLEQGSCSKISVCPKISQIDNRAEVAAPFSYCTLRFKGRQPRCVQDLNFFFLSSGFDHLATLFDLIMPASSRPKMSRTVDEEQWESHKDKIHDLYVKKNGRLLHEGGLMQEMERCFDFHAS